MLSLSLEKVQYVLQGKRLLAQDSLLKVGATCGVLLQTDFILSLTSDLEEIFVHDRLPLSMPRYPSLPRLFMPSNAVWHQAQS